MPPASRVALLHGAFSPQPSARLRLSPRFWAWMGALAKRRRP
jgi:hypothetical protein